MNKRNAKRQGDAHGKKAFLVEHSHYDAEWCTVYENYAAMMRGVVSRTLRVLEENPERKFVLDQVPLFEAVKNGTEPIPLLESAGQGPTQLFFNLWCRLNRKHFSSKKKDEDQRSDFERLKELIKAGRIEIGSGMYVQPDTNIPAGESLVRQSLYGKKYFQKEFGVEPRVVWNIDVFGQSAQLPQILAKSGYDYYAFTRGAKKHKSDENPQDLKSEFLWQGADGTSILTHWMSEHYDAGYAYRNKKQGKKIIDAFRKLSPRAATGNVLIPMGSDFRAQGLKTQEVVRKLNEEGRLNARFATPTEFFKAVGDEGFLHIFETVSTDELDTLLREFNPTFQGCYSSRIKIKQENRKCESAALASEKFATLSRAIGTGPNRSNEIEDSWKKVLYNQFHDVISGCHTDVVYKRTMSRYASASAGFSKILNDSLNEIASAVKCKKDSGTPVVVFNPLSWDVSRPRIVRAKVPLPASSGVLQVSDSKGRRADYCRITSGPDEKGTVEVEFAATAPSLGYETYYVSSAASISDGAASSASASTRTATTNAMRTLYRNSNAKNKDMTVRLNTNTASAEIDCKTGAITSLSTATRRGDRSAITGPLNRLFIQKEKGDTYHTKPTGCKEYLEVQSIEEEVLPGVGKRLIVNGKLGRHAKVTEQVTFYDSCGRIDFSIHADYDGKRRRTLKTEFELPKTDAVYHEIPYGRIRTNTTAGGPVPVQNYIQFPDAGITITNQGLPAHEITKGDDEKSQKLELTLLRSVGLLANDFYKLKNFTAMPLRVSGEKGKFDFNYSMIFDKETEAYKAGAETNNGLYAVTPNKLIGKPFLREKHSFLKTYGEGFDVPVLKISEDGRDLVARVVETDGALHEGAAAARIAFNIPGRNFTKYIPADLMEKEALGIERLDYLRNSGGTRNGCYSLLDATLKPFEISTYRIR